MSWDESFQEFRDRVRDALNNQRLRTALDRATETIYAARKRALSRLPYYSYIEKRAREIKTWSIEHLPELIQSTKEAVEELGGVFYLAKDAKDLNEYVAKICEQHDAKLVVKSKSMTTLLPQPTFGSKCSEECPRVGGRVGGRPKASG